MSTAVTVPGKELLPKVASAGPEQALVTNAREILNTLHGIVRAHGRDRSRIRSLVTFKERTHVVKNADGEETRVSPITQVRHGDRPEIEMYLEHRDAAMILKENIAKLWAKVHATPDTMDNLEVVHRITAKIDRLEEKQVKHMAAMTHILDNLSKEQDRGIASMLKIASDGAKLAQAATQHEDKMEIAREVVKEASTEDLLAKVAAKHGITVQQAQQILSAKTIETGSDDAG